MMIVPDFSRYQKDNSLAREYLRTTDNTIIIFKATEGMSYKDEQTPIMLREFLDHMQGSFEAGIGHVSIGLYHFCRLDKKDSMETARERALKEATWYCSVVRDLRRMVSTNYDMNVKFIPIIDWEGENTSQPKREEYLCEFVGKIYGEFGTAPIIYVSGAFTNTRECNAVKQQFPDVPLWVAHYNTNSPRFSVWKDWLAWQFTSKPFDLSFVRASLFDAYCVKKWDKE